MTVASSLRFFFMIVFMCIFPWCVLFEAWRRLHVYKACLSLFFIMLLYGICSFSLSAVARHICPIFVNNKYILYPMLSYRFIAHTAIFLQYYKLYAFCSVQKKNSIKVSFDKHPCNVDQVLDKYMCIVFCVFLDLCILWWSENFVFILVTNNLYQL